MFFTPAVSGRLHRGPPTYPNTRPNLRRKSTLQVIAPGSGCRRNSWRTMIENSSWRKCRRSEGFVVGVDTTGGGKKTRCLLKPSLKLIVCPLKIGLHKRTSSSNHPFSGAMLVSGRLKLGRRRMSLHPISYFASR